MILTTSMRLFVPTIYEKNVFAYFLFKMYHNKEYGSIDKTVVDLYFQGHCEIRKFLNYYLIFMSCCSGQGFC